MELKKTFVGQLASKEVRKIYKEYGIPFYSALACRKKFSKSWKVADATSFLKAIFGEGWYVVATYPILTPQAYGAYVLLTKVFQIPKQLFQEDLNKPGYMDRVLTAGDYYDLLEYYREEL